jgi:broad specificity phosphatase PhoE
MKVYFVRHGESEANLLHEFSNRGFKHGLTQRGQQQATALAQSLKNASITKVFSSPLRRAVQTAEILASALHVPYEITDALREYDCGILEGHSDAASWQADWVLSEAWIERHEWDKRIAQGESFHDMQRRFCPFVEQLVQAHRLSDENYVLVGHGGIYRCMLPLILSNIDFAFVLKHEIRHTAAIVAEVRPSGLVCAAWGDATLTNL